MKKYQFLFGTANLLTEDENEQLKDSHLFSFTFSNPSVCRIMLQNIFDRYNCFIWSDHDRLKEMCKTLACPDLEEKEFSYEKLIAPYVEFDIMDIDKCLKQILNDAKDPTADEFFIFLYQHHRYTDDDDFVRENGYIFHIENLKEANQKLIYIHKERQMDDETEENKVCGTTKKVYQENMFHRSPEDFGMEEQIIFHKSEFIQKLFTEQLVVEFSKDFKKQLKKYRIILGQQQIWSEDGKKDKLQCCQLFSVSFYSAIEITEFETRLSKSEPQRFWDFFTRPTKEFVNGLKEMLYEAGIRYCQFQVKNLDTEHFQFREHIESRDTLIYDLFIDANRDEIDYLYLILASKHEFYPYDPWFRDCACIYKCVQQKETWTWNCNSVYMTRSVDDEIEDQDTIGTIEVRTYNHFTPYATPDSLNIIPLVWNQNDQTLLYGIPDFIKDVLKIIQKFNHKNTTAK